MLNVTEVLGLLFNEPVSSGKAFDKKAKKIIRSQYKLINEKFNDQISKTKASTSQSERKDVTSRSALSALASGNASTTDLNRSNISEMMTKEAMNNLENQAQFENQNGIS